MPITAALEVMRIGLAGSAFAGTSRFAPTCWKKPCGRTSVHCSRSQGGLSKNMNDVWPSPPRTAVWII